MRIFPLNIALAILVLFEIRSTIIASEDSSQDIISTRYEIRLDLLSPKGELVREISGLGCCLLRWEGGKASGSIQIGISYPSISSPQKIPDLPIIAEKTKNGSMKIYSSSSSPIRFSFVLTGRIVESPALTIGLPGDILWPKTLRCVRWDGTANYPKTFFSKVPPGIEKMRIILTGGPKRSSAIKYPPADYSAFYRKNSDPRPELIAVVKTSKEIQAKALLEEQGLNWEVYDDLRPWLLDIWAPNIRRGNWVKSLFDSRLFDYISLVDQEGRGGAGDAASLKCRTTGIFSVDLWNDPDEGRRQTYEFFKKIVVESFKGKTDVTIEWLTGKKPHSYRALITGTSKSIGRGAAGLWEQHEFEVSFFDQLPFDPLMDSKQDKKKNIFMTITQIKCKSAHAPASVPPPLQRYDFDESEGSDRFLEKFADSIMQNERAITRQ